MSVAPEEHPAVVQPQKVLAKAPVITNTQALNNQGNNAKPVVQQQSVRNAEERLLDRIFPNQMTNVSVRPMASNPNKLVKSVGYGAWTQSKTLIYYTHPKANADADTRLANDALKPFILFHEGLHIKQFRRKGSPPSSFEEMLKFELGTYKTSDHWIRSEGRSKKFYTNNNRAAYYDWVRDMSKEVLASVNLVLLTSIALKLGYIAIRGFHFMLQAVPLVTTKPAPPDVSFNDVVFKNMRDNALLPALISGKNTYTVNDLYAQTSDPDFYGQFGY